MAKRVKRNRVLFSSCFFWLFFISGCEFKQQSASLMSEGETTEAELPILSTRELPSPVIVIATRAPDATETIMTVPESTSPPATVQPEPSTTPLVTPIWPVISQTVPIFPIKKAGIGDAVPLSYDLLFLQNYNLKLWRFQEGVVEILLGPYKNEDKMTTVPLRRYIFYKGPLPPPPLPPGAVIFFLVSAGNQKVLSCQYGRLILLDPYTKTTESTFDVGGTKNWRPSLSPDARYLVYVAQDTNSDMYEVYLKQLFDEQPTRVLEECWSRRMPSHFPFLSYSCSPVWLSNSAQVFWDDYRGVWTSNLDGTPAQLLLKNEFDDAGGILTKAYELSDLPPNGRNLFLFTHTISGTFPIIFDSQSNQITATAENIRSWRWPVVQWADGSLLYIARMEDTLNLQSSELVLQTRNFSWGIVDEFTLELQNPMALRDIRQMANGKIALMMVGNSNSTHVKTETDIQGILVLDLTAKVAEWFSFNTLCPGEMRWYEFQVNWLPDASAGIVRCGADLWLIPDDFSIIYSIPGLRDNEYVWLQPP